MRTALRVRRPRAQVAELRTIPAPIGGWNARDPLAAMPKMDAVRLENWYPRATDCILRGGSSNHVTGIPARTKTLAVYSALDGSEEMYAATDAEIYDATAAGAVGASVSTITNGRFQWVNYGDGGTQYLIMVNGVDKPRYYNGATWIAVDAASSPALSGLTTTTIVHVNVHKERLYFIPVDSLSFWYLAAGAVGGALTEFPLESYCKKGGYLMAMGTWTIDGGAGIDDLAVFISSQGEVVVFSGNNPGSASAWSLVGIYQVGKPLGRRCLQKVAGDLVLITETGVLPLSRALQSSAIDKTVALSDRIVEAFQQAALSYGDAFGWEVTVYPREAALLVNVPTTEDSVSQQYVMNLLTRRWCKFTGWNASCFAVMGGELYYGDDTAVVKAWTGTDDKGTNIASDGKHAFYDMGAPDALKRLVGLRMKLIAETASLNFLIGADVDYTDRRLSGTATYSAPSGSAWGVGRWGSAVWAGAGDIRQEWQSAEVYEGHVFAGKIKLDSMGDAVRWVATDYLFERGAVI